VEIMMFAFWPAIPSPSPGYGRDFNVIGFETVGEQVFSDENNRLYCRMVTSVRLIHDRIIMFNTNFITGMEKTIRYDWPSNIG
jgi:hypothetical protein